MFVSWLRPRAAALAVFFVLAGLFGASTGLAAPAFPEPEAIRGNVDFWLRVFSEWGQAQVVVHDLDHPQLVYEIVDLPGPVEPRYTADQRALVEDLREAWQGFLRSLEGRVAAGEPLSDIEVRWRDHVAEMLGEGGLTGAEERVRTQRGLRERFREGLGRSSAYEARIREILEGEGLPGDLAYLPHVESSFQYHARSAVGAAGLWQFTRSTGRRYLRIDSVVDERLDPLLATRGAARYLRDAYDQLGSWPLALTSYNHGVQGMLRAKAELGDDFERIYREYRGRLFGFASKNFYAEFLAAREIARNPGHYFPEGYDPEPPVDHDEIVLDRGLRPSALARSHGLATAELASLNPGWTRNAVARDLTLPAGTRVWLPAGAARTARLLPDDRAEDDAEGVVHVVARGQTLSGIAAQHRVRLDDLRHWNGIEGAGNIIRVGQRLRLAPEATSAPADREHVVRRGDTLLRIAARYGVHLVDLLAENTLTVQSIIHPGQVLRIPPP